MKKILLLTASLLFVGWVSLRGADNNHYLQITTSEAKTNSWDWEIQYVLDEPLVSGKTYQLTMLAKCSEERNLSFWPYNSGDGGKTVYTGNKVTTEWKNWTCEFEANDALTHLKWVFGDFKGTICMDNVKLVEKENPSVNIVSDDFEGGTLSSKWMANSWCRPTFGIANDFIEAKVPTGEVELTKEMFKEWTSAEKETTATSSTPNFAQSLNAECGEGAAVYGDGNVYYLNFADLSDYNGMKIYGTGGNLRVLFNRLTDGGALTELSVAPTEEGTLIDFASYEYVHLNSIKVAWGATATVSSITLLDPNAPVDISYVLNGDYTNEGVSSSAASALTDATATVIDATGVTGTGITLTSANPNCIFIAKEGVLANTENVCVDGTVNKLAITDGKPFVLPAAATTATAATYSRTTTGTFGTICLPYAVSSTDAVKYYTIDKIENGVLKLKAEATLAAGTPAIVEKLSGSAITATGSGALAAPATTVTDLKLVGTLEDQTILAADHAGKKIYALSGDQFVQATNSINLKAFRAYFTADASAPANLRLSSDDEATAINALAGEQAAAVVGIYGTDGAQRPSLQKGLNVVKLQNGKTQKILVK